MTGVRDDVLMQLVDKAMSDPDFRSHAQRDPDGALAAHGFDLNDDELAAVKEFQQQTAELPPDELNGAIANQVRRQGS